MCKVNCNLNYYINNCPCFVEGLNMLVYADNAQHYNHLAWYEQIEHAINTDLTQKTCTQEH